MRRRRIANDKATERWGATDDLRGVAIFLASAASDCVTGHVLLVDGGWMAR